MNLKAYPVSWPYARALLEEVPIIATIGNSASPQWRTLYEAAVLELNRDKLLQRIAEALRAIMDRMEDLDRSEDRSESEALMNALNALHDLRKMADSDGQSQV